MPPRTRKKAAAKVEAAATENLVQVCATPYTEDDEWDGTPEMIEEVSTIDQPLDPNEDTVKRRPGRQVSSLIVATRAFEDAHKAADKARSRIAKVQPLVDALAELEKAEQDAYAALQEELGKLGS